MHRLREFECTVLEGSLLGIAGVWRWSWLLGMGWSVRGHARGNRGLVLRPRAFSRGSDFDLTDAGAT